MGITDFPLASIGTADICEICLNLRDLRSAEDNKISALNQETIARRHQETLARQEPFNH